MKSNIKKLQNKKDAKQLKHMVKKCEEHGITVNFSKVFLVCVDEEMSGAEANVNIPFAGWVNALNTFLPEFDLIVIDAKASASAKLHLLIHEFGHVLQKIFLNKSLEKEIATKMLAISYSAKTDRKTKAQLVTYENEAWELGEAFAKQIGIKLNKSFYALKNDKLQSYKNLKKE